MPIKLRKGTRVESTGTIVLGPGLDIVHDEDGLPVVTSLGSAILSPTRGGTGRNAKLFPHGTIFVGAGENPMTALTPTEEKQILAVVDVYEGGEDPEEDPPAYTLGWVTPSSVGAGTLTWADLEGTLPAEKLPVPADPATYDFVVWELGGGETGSTLFINGRLAVAGPMSFGVLTVTTDFVFSTPVDPSTTLTNARTLLALAGDSGSVQRLQPVAGMGKLYLTSNDDGQMEWTPPSAAGLSLNTIGGGPLNPDRGGTGQNADNFPPGTIFVADGPGQMMYPLTPDPVTDLQVLLGEYRPGENPAIPGAQYHLSWVSGSSLWNLLGNLPADKLPLPDANGVVNWQLSAAGPGTLNILGSLYVQGGFDMGVLTVTSDFAFNTPVDPSTTLTNARTILALAGDSGSVHRFQPVAGLGKLYLSTNNDGQMEWTPPSGGDLSLNLIGGGPLLPSRGGTGLDLTYANPGGLLVVNQENPAGTMEVLIPDPNEPGPQYLLATPWTNTQNPENPVTSFSYAWIPAVASNTDAGSLTSGNLAYARMPIGTGTWDVGGGALLTLAAQGVTVTGGLTVNNALGTGTLTVDTGVVFSNLGTPVANAPELLGINAGTVFKFTGPANVGVSHMLIFEHTSGTFQWQSLTSSGNDLNQMGGTLQPWKGGTGRNASYDQPGTIYYAHPNNAPGSILSLEAAAPTGDDQILVASYLGETYYLNWVPRPTGSGAVAAENVTAGTFPVGDYVFPGRVSAGTARTGVAGTGSVRMVNGSTSSIGMVEFFKPTGVRAGYIGAETDGLNIVPADGNLILWGTKTINGTTTFANQAIFNGGITIAGTGNLTVNNTLTAGTLQVNAGVTFAALLNDSSTTDALLGLSTGGAVFPFTGPNGATADQLLKFNYSTGVMEWAPMTAASNDLNLMSGTLQPWKGGTGRNASYDPPATIFYVHPNVAPGSQLALEAASPNEGITGDQVLVARRMHGAMGDIFGLQWEAMPAGGGTAGVSSFNNRTGAVMPQAADYSAHYAFIIHSQNANTITAGTFGGAEYTMRKLVVSETNGPSVLVVDATLPGGEITVPMGGITAQYTAQDWSTGRVDFHGPAPLGGRQIFVTLTDTGSGPVTTLAGRLYVNSGLSVVTGDVGTLGSGMSFGFVDAADRGGEIQSFGDRPLRLNRLGNRVFVGSWGLEVAGNSRFDGVVDFGQTPTVNGVPISGGGGSSTLSGLSDVQLTSLAADNILKWNGSSWVNVAMPSGGSSGGAGAFDSLTVNAALKGRVRFRDTLTVQDQFSNTYVTDLDLVYTADNQTTLSGLHLKRSTYAYGVYSPFHGIGLFTGAQLDWAWGQDHGSTDYVLAYNPVRGDILRMLRPHGQMLLGSGIGSPIPVHQLQIITRTGTGVVNSLTSSVEPGSTANHFLAQADGSACAVIQKNGQAAFGKVFEGFVDGGSEFRAAITIANRNYLNTDYAYDPMFQWVRRGAGMGTTVIQAMAAGNGQLRFDGQGNNSAWRTSMLVIDPTVNGVGIGDGPGAGIKLDVAGHLRCVGFTDASDAILKKNVQSLVDILPRISRLRAVTYEWQDSFPHGEEGAHVGVIAQELEAEFPELVHTSDDYKSVDYGKLAAVVMQGLIELEQRVAALESN
jgi:hypothetical protein